jgi:RNA recognition motif-containing protein
MNKKIYVGNLPYSATESDVRNLFAQHGEVVSVRLITDRETGRAKGFGFVEMNGPDADNAIEALNGFQYGGRNLRVNEALERNDRPDRGDRRPPRRY